MYSEPLELTVLLLIVVLMLGALTSPFCRLIDGLIGVNGMGVLLADLAIGIWGIAILRTLRKQSTKGK